jgi:hypothetical protein
MLFISGIFLLYSSVVVPFQIFMWDNSEAADECHLFPTLLLDVGIDTFFMARQHTKAFLRVKAVGHTISFCYKLDSN